MEENSTIWKSSENESGGRTYFDISVMVTIPNIYFNLGIIFFPSLWLLVKGRFINTGLNMNMWHLISAVWIQLVVSSALDERCQFTNLMTSAVITFTISRSIYSFMIVFITAALVGHTLFIKKIIRKSRGDRRSFWRMYFFILGMYLFVFILCLYIFCYEFLVVEWTALLNETTSKLNMDDFANFIEVFKQRVFKQTTAAMVVCNLHIPVYYHAEEVFECDDDYPSTMIILLILTLLGLFLKYKGYY